ncbi:hypothetical protein [Tissierella sp.]|uniref:phage tail protein n=1 Tax=Tissierella sp. TaxID=41274 RepID=UPI00303FBCC9
MAEGTSVGKIQLDIEISKSSITKEMEELSKGFNSGIKGSFGNIGSQMTGFVRNTISSMANRFKSFAQVGSDSNKQVAQSTDDINIKMQQLVSQMESATNRAEMHRQKLLELQAQYDRLSRAGMGDSDKGRKLLEQITITEDRVRRYGDVSDRTRLKIEQLGRSMESLGETTNKSNKGFKKSETAAKKTGRSFKLLGDQASKSSSRVGGFANMISSTFMRILKRIFIINLIYKAIRGLINYMGSALKTNKQFASSLNTIKTNLRVAFQPIYDFILPALNVLMQAVAKVTTYIATAISALFGKTYKQSYDSAKGIETAKKALDGYGKAAKKAKGALAGFDEINQLDISDDKDSGGGSGEFEMEMPDTSTIDISGLEKFKEVMADLFKPFKLAWESEGLNVINAAKYALESMKGLIGAIGNSWREVWTNGTSQAIIESVLRILQLVLNIIGDIANAFKIAWATNELGTKLLQTILDMILSILGLIETLGVSWREVWNNGKGAEMLTHILSILQSIFNLIGQIADSFRIAWETNNMGTQILQNIADSLNIILGVFDEIGTVINEVWGEVGQKTIDILMRSLQSATEILKIFGETLKIAWDMGGKYLFEQLILLAAKVIEVAGVIWNDFIAPIAKGLLDILGPAFGRALEFAGAMVEGIIWWLDVLLKGLDIIKTFAEKVIEFFKWLYDVLVGHSIVPDLVNEVTEWFSNLGKWVGEKVKALVDAVIKFFTDLWNGVKKITEEIWKGLTTFLDNTWNNIKTKATTIFNNIKDTISNIFNAIKTTTSNIWNGITSGLTNAFNSIYNGAVNIFNKMSDFIKGITDGIAGFFKGMVNGVIKALNFMINGLNRLNVAIPDWVPGIGGKSLGFNIPDIPMLAKGGIIDQPTLAMVGERGKEAVVPLENTAFVDTLASALGNAVMAAMQMGNISQSSGEGGDTILQIDGMTIGRILGPILDKEKGRIGNTIIQPI